MNIFGESMFVNKHKNGDAFLTIEPEVAMLLLHAYPDGGAKLHRTKVEDMNGDALDMVELEMVNDDVASRAQNTVGGNNKEVLEILYNTIENKSSAIIPLDDNNIRKFLMFANLLHVSRVNVSNTEVGAAQGNDDLQNIFDVANNNDLDKIIHFIIISLINELTDLWIV